jgi:tRNA-splicing ligase RtcB
MRVPAQIYASEELIDSALQDRSLVQLVNVSTLPGVVERVVAMPDIHEGYGFPIGGVAATELPSGAVSPGGVGYDINCGVRLLLSDITRNELAPRIGEIATELARAIPSGTGRGGRIRLSSREMDEVLTFGAKWCVRRDWGESADLEHLEDGGSFAGADPERVSERAKARGRDQLGTIGSGNHFLEIQYIEEIFNEAAAQAFGLTKDGVVIAIHCGSRGLGHQVCGDYVKLMLAKQSVYGFEIPDRELASAPADSPEGAAYLSAMAAAANFAWANRQVIAHHVAIEWQNVFGKTRRLSTLYDVCHNVAKKEKHTIRGEEKELLVHRKGATRAFASGRPEVPASYREVGQPVLIPGTMGTASYVLAGTEEAMRRTFGTVCHGAGRRLSRHAAKAAVSGRELRAELEGQGIVVRSYSDSGLAEEAPSAYKDIEAVINVVEAAGLSRRVARLRPLAVIKGE